MITKADGDDKENSGEKTPVKQSFSFLVHYLKSEREREEAEKQAKIKAEDRIKLINKISALEGRNRTPEQEKELIEARRKLADESKPTEGLGWCDRQGRDGESSQR